MHKTFHLSLSSLLDDEAHVPWPVPPVHIPGFGTLVPVPSSSYSSTITSTSPEVQSHYAQHILILATVNLCAANPTVRVKNRRHSGTRPAHDQFANLEPKPHSFNQTYSCSLFCSAIKRHQLNPTTGTHARTNARPHSDSQQRTAVVVPRHTTPRLCHAPTTEPDSI